jgi:hypothetical protein
MAMITIIGRGHSGTRALAQTLYASNVYMGRRINPSGDLVPPDSMYEACRILARHICYKGELSWDWSSLHTMEIDPEFIERIHDYLATVLANPSPHKGWKIPESTLVLPWLVRLFPETRYIYLIRNPRDSILGPHMTDDLAAFGVPSSPTEDERLRRAISWKYQYDIVASTPKPKYWLELRFEDFVFHQEETLSQLEAFLGIPLARIVVRSGSVGRYRLDAGKNYFNFFATAMRDNRYELP